MVVNGSAASRASDDGRAQRILAEYLQPLQLLRRERIQDAIVFLGSARLGPQGALGGYCEEARELARRVTEWSKSLASPAERVVVCTGSGGGIMEAANRGASEVGGSTIELDAGLAHEEGANRYAPGDLRFEFHDFFMRKLWFAHLARGLVAFPGGFGTLDELTDVLRLAQARKLARRIPIVLYGSVYWKEVVDFEALARYGMIAPDDLRLFAYADDPGTALRILQGTSRQHARQALA
jgi:hypothetical protein